MHSPTKPTPHWYILGAGAIGSLWAAYWARDKQAASCIVRQPPQQTQLTVHHQQQSFNVTPHQITATDITTPIKRLLVTTKAHQTRSALAGISRHLSDDAIIIILQNGLIAQSIEVLPTQTLIAATTTDGAHFQNKNNLHHIGPGLTHLGLIRPKQSPYSIEQLPSIIKQLPSRLNVQVCESIEERLWQKFAVNCAINALGVKYQCTNGELISNPNIRAELKLLCEEISQVTAALNLGPWFQNIYQKVTEVAELTGSNINSTLQDIQQGKETEIRALNGYLCHCARKNHIPAPHNESLLALVLEQEKQS